MPTLADVAAMLNQQPYAVISTIRPSGTVQSTLVNVGLYEDGVGLTTVGGSLKERNLKRNPACTVTIHHGPYWITVEGKARLRTWDDTDRTPCGACCGESTLRPVAPATTGRPMTGSCAKNAVPQW